jgi:hypothetical protein
MPCCRPSGGDWIPAKQTKRYKESHKATEKHRRDKINVSLGILSDLVPQVKVEFLMRTACTRC